MYDYIAEHGSPTAAARNTEAIVEYCEGLAGFAHRGARRDDIRAGPLMAHYKRRAVIALEVNEGSNPVAILGVYCGGRDCESALGDDDDSARLNWDAGQWIARDRVTEAGHAHQRRGRAAFQ